MIIRHIKPDILLDFRFCLTQKVMIFQWLVYTRQKTTFDFALNSTIFYCCILWCKCIIKKFMKYFNLIWLRIPTIRFQNDKSRSFWQDTYSGLRPLSSQLVPGNLRIANKGQARTLKENTHPEVMKAILVKPSLRTLLKKLS